MKRKRKPATKAAPLKVVILGAAVNYDHWGNYPKAKGWEIWGLNAIRPLWARPWARMFNLHRLAHLERDCPQYVDWDSVWSRRNPKVPLYTVDSWGPLLTNGVLFPIKELRALPRGGVYHASSFDMMTAFAIYLKAAEIVLHGINFHMESGEPISGRACLEYWVGVAEGRGIKVTIAKDCQIFKQYHYVKSDSVYGYDDVRIIEDRTK